MLAVRSIRAAPTARRTSHPQEDGATGRLICTMLGQLTILLR